QACWGRRRCADWSGPAGNGRALAREARQGPPFTGPSGRSPQLGLYGQLEDFLVRETLREEEDLQSLDLAGLRIEPCDDFVIKHLGVLLRVRGDHVDVEDVSGLVVAEG